MLNEPAIDGPSIASVGAEGGSLQQARLQADHGNLEQALETLQTLLDKDRSDPEIYELLGNVHLALQQTEQARAAFERVLYLLPDHTDALLHLALICQRQGDLQQAARYRHRAARSHDPTRSRHGTNS